MEKEGSAPAEEAPRPLFRLKLDHDDVYFGCEPIPETEAMDGDAILDHAPDNAPGKYRWSREFQRLEPLIPDKQKTEPGAPTLEQAFCDLIESLPVMIDLPKSVFAWRAWFRTTVDGRNKK